MNQETKHAPGPWGIEVLENGLIDVIDANGDLVAEIEPCNPYTKANAWSIAAAPDLLAVAEALLALGISDVGEVIDMAREAVDKAKGGQP